MDICLSWENPLQRNLSLSNVFLGDIRVAKSGDHANVHQGPVYQKKIPWVPDPTVLPDLQDGRVVQCVSLAAFSNAVHFLAHKISRTLVPPLPQIVECPCVSLFDTSEPFTRQGTTKFGGGILRT